VTWSAELSYSRNHNTLVALGRGVLANKAQGLVAGYPVGGRWARPILGFADENGDSVLQRSEIRLGDSLVYLGRLLPAYTTALFTNMALFGGAVGLTAGFSYEAGMTQIDETARQNWVLARALVDPSAPLREQAAVIAYTANDSRVFQMSIPPTDYGLTQAVSTFRFNTLSVNYRAPMRVARLLGAQQLSVAVQGHNLALHSTYRGKDPDVSAWNPDSERGSESIVDTGQLPLPRTWQLAVFLDY
jgi:hypothetical protein